MTRREIPDTAIETVAHHINSRSNKNYGINPIGTEGNVETPQVFEIIPFDEIDNTERRFYAIDGSHNTEQFYNGLAIAVYTAGYICYHHGQQLRMNSLDDPVILGQAYYPQNILVTNEDHLYSIYDEFLSFRSVKHLLDFFSEDPSKIFPIGKEQISLEALADYWRNRWLSQRRKHPEVRSAVLGFRPEDFSIQ